MKKVTVITRTKNRPLMLKRAFQSIASQRYTDFDWIIVNDGGDIDSLESMIDNWNNDSMNIILHHNNQSQGRGAAANIGISLSESKYIVLHDDDDTWKSSFLQKTVTFLEAQTHESNIKGVVTKCYKVSEIIKDKEIIIKKMAPYNPNLFAVTLIQMGHVYEMVPPPISFICRRDALLNVGNYRVDLPVLEDWEFYLRFLRKYDIAVIPEYLANYHWRENLNSKNSCYGNSVVSEVDIHSTYYAVILNQLLREDLDKGQIGMGFLINLCCEFQSIQSQLRPWTQLLSILKQNFKILRPIYEKFKSKN